MSAEQNCPEKLLNRYEKRFEKREKRSEKRSETRPKTLFSPSQAASKYFAGTFQQILKVFHRRKTAQHKKFFFTARLCRGSHANIGGQGRGPTTSGRCRAVEAGGACGTLWSCQGGGVGAGVGTKPHQKVFSTLSGFARSGFRGRNDSSEKARRQ